MSQTSTVPGVKGRLFTWDYIFTCVTTFFFFSGFHLLLPGMPIYVEALGGSEFEVGLVMGAFTVTAVVLRPWVGPSTDVRGRRLFMLIGAFIFLTAQFAYNFATSVPLLIALRLWHGVGMACFMTAAPALIADLAPPPRRGEALGYFGAVTGVTMAVTPAVGIALLNAYGFTVMFFTSAAVALTAVVLAFFVSEPKRPRPNGGSSRPALVSRAALMPSALVMALTLTYGALITFVPLYALKQGMSNPGLFFMVYAMAMVVSRPIAGRLSDIFGRTAVMVPGLLLAAAAMWLLAISSSVPLLFVVAALYGLGFGTAYPALMALLADRVEVGQRGAGMATFTAAFDLGIGIGSIFWGLVVQFTGFGIMFFASGLAPAASVLYLGFQRLTKHGREDARGDRP